MCLQTGYTALIYAAQSGHAHVVRELLSSLATVNLANDVSKKKFNNYYVFEQLATNASQALYNACVLKRAVVVMQVKPYTMHVYSREL